jgi:DNA-binding Lrp family transcriptional regulator
MAHTSRTAYGVVSLEIAPIGRIAAMVSLTPTKEQKEFARMLGLDASDLAKRVALNSANGIKRGDYVSTSVRELPLIAAHARSESFQPIPAGIAAMPKTLTKDAVSDTATLAEIARQLGIEPTELARRLAAQPADGE